MENRDQAKKETGFLSGFLLGLLTCLLVFSAAFAGRTLYRYFQTNLSYQAAGSDGDSFIGAGNAAVDEATIKKMNTIEELISENYYRSDVTKEQMETGIYKGMVASLDDPYSEYYSADELVDAHAKMEGVTYGIGAYISYDEERDLAVISGIIEGGSAEEADLREGDYIVKVDDEDVQGYTSAEVVALVRGQENTMVHITIYREGETDFLEYDLQRKKALEKATVIYDVLDNDIGYVRILEFDEITKDQYTEAMAVLKENNVKGMILDLRSNPGGNVSTVTDIARKILPAGLIVYTEDRSGRREEYTCDGTQEWELPLVVLVNEYSASASEILAGAIQDYDKGIVIGTATYGKGVVQRIITLSDGTAVKLTVSSYYTPLGRSLGGVGITPDEELDLDRKAYYELEIDNQLERAIAVMTEKINNN